MLNIFLALLTVLFIGLKLTGYITWSWLLVLSPLIFLACVIIFVLFIAAIAAYMAFK